MIYFFLSFSWNMTWPLMCGNRSVILDILNKWLNYWKNRLQMISSSLQLNALWWIASLECDRCTDRWEKLMQTACFLLFFLLVTLEEIQHPTIKGLLNLTEADCRQSGIISSSLIWMPRFLYQYNHVTNIRIKDQYFNMYLMFDFEKCLNQWWDIKPDMSLACNLLQTDN